MALSHSSNITTNGLVFATDLTTGTKTYLGGPFTNLIGSTGGDIQGFPQAGNSWGTYNTNQYNNNTYFSIGAIAGVSNNIISTTAAHPLRTFDVVTPQSSGGGVTAGTSYLVNKLSPTTFTLHTYDATQDGSKTIAQIYSSFYGDNRIAVTTGVSNMWWGPPHLANSGLVKTIVKNGFNFNGRIHDCIRMNMLRSDGVFDGMAYGVTPTLTQAGQYTISWYMRAATPTAVGQSIYYQMYSTAVSTTIAAVSFAVNANWTKCVVPASAPTGSGQVLSYWFPSGTTTPYAVDISEIVIETGYVAHEYITNTRTATQGLLDYAGNSSLDLTNAAYDGAGNLTFNGSSSYIAGPSNLNYDNCTIIYVAKCTNFGAGVRTSVFSQYYAGTGAQLEWQGVDGTVATIRSGFRDASAATTQENNALGGTGVLTVNTTYCVAATYSAKTVSHYLNGALLGSNTNSNQNTVTSAGALNIGRNDSAGLYFNGSIYQVLIYNRALTATEITQNFNALRGRYGI